ncbi:MAG: tetratricopeptide repeat protein [Proteobacteria bacterium]|nr:tetratricopeptide repeat protein [Pseudomonadota bacterium]NIS69822.1 tetratricopeptide repeat protein [Pseudomonadota bacterium]
MRVLRYIRPIRLYLMILGGLCVAYGIYQKYWYSDLIGEAVKAIETNRLDEQKLEKARDSLFGSEDLILYNMGVRAYRADNLKKASEHFFNVIRKSGNPSLKQRAYYNLGNILVKLELPKKAAEMYRESLRLDPNDWECKYNLERLYVFYPMAFPDESGKASLNQQPGDDEGDKNQKGRQGADQPDI